MFKLNFFMRKRADQSLDQFSNYWRERHGPFAMSGRTTALGMKRYVQNHLTNTPLAETLAATEGLSGASYEGICQLWFDSEEAVLHTRDSATGTGATNDLVEDERNFLDLEGSSIRFYREEDILRKSAGSGAHKLIIGSFVRDGSSGVGSAISDLLTTEAAKYGVSAAVQNFGLDTPANDKLRAPRGNDRDAFDHVVELWFFDYASIANAVTQSDGLLVRILEELRSRPGGEGIAAWVAQERIMIDGAGDLAAAA